MQADETDFENFKSCPAWGRLHILASLIPFPRSDTEKLRSLPDELRLELVVYAPKENPQLHAVSFQIDVSIKKGGGEKCWGARTHYRVLLSNVSSNTVLQRCLRFLWVSVRAGSTGPESESGRVSDDYKELLLQLASSITFPKGGACNASSRGRLLIHPTRLQDSC